MLWAQRNEHDGELLVPTRHGDGGWFDFQSVDARHRLTRLHIHSHYLSQDPADLAWLDEVCPQRQGFERNEFKPVPGYWTPDDNWVAFKGGPCPPTAWFAWIEGRNPGYPEQILDQTRHGVYRALDRIAGDDADVDDVICNHYHPLIPVAAAGILQMQLGTPSPVYNGGFLHSHLCYFDPQRRRIGIPDDVAALVDSVSADSAAVTLVNTDPTTPRDVLLQAGMYGEHEFTAVHADGGPPVDIDGRWVRVRLAPSAQTHLELGMRRFAHQPAYGHPTFD
jgi:hypothetical protein